MSTPAKKLSEGSAPSRAIAHKAAGQLKQFLTSSSGIAAIASLTFHGVLLAAIPRFSSASFAAFGEENTAAVARTVPLVTLSPAEQGRLPDFNRSQLPSIPDITASTPLTKLPDTSILERSNSALSDNRLSLSSPSLLSRNRPFRNPYITTPNFSIINPPSRSNQSSAGRTTILNNIPPPNTLPEVEQESELPENETQLEQPIEPANEPTEPDNVGASDQTETTPDANAETLAANSEAPSQLERLQAKFNYSDDNTTEEDETVNFEQWLEAHSEETIQAPETQELIVGSGLNLCAANPPKNGKLGVLVAADGSPSEVAVLRSTGYEYLNQAATETLMLSEFPVTDVPVRYLFDIVVGYDSETCRSLDDVLETVQQAEQAADSDPEAASEDSQPPALENEAQPSTNE